MKYDLSYLSVPLPEDVLKLKLFGDFEGANVLIDYLVQQPNTPDATKQRLVIEKDVLKMMGINEYPYSESEAIELMAQEIKGFKTEELTYYAKVNSTVGVPVNLYAETVYEITVQDDRFLPILEDTVFHANVDYLISLDLI